MADETNNGADVLAGLSAASFNAVHFPVTSMTMSVAHDLAPHTYWGVDGARIEATGLEPIRFTFEVPFSNRIYPGKQEKWRAGSLYPTVIRGLLRQFVKKADGTLIHPEFGEIRVKADKMDIRWSGDKRGGAEASLSFVETLPPLGELAKLPGESPVQNIVVACGTLDIEVANLRALIPTLPVHKTSFADFARAIQSIADQITILQFKTFGAINQLLYRCQTLSESLDRAKNASVWPAKAAIERVESAGYSLRRDIVRYTKSLAIYTVLVETTLSGVQAALPDATIADLIKLNPDLVREPTIKANTPVRYYKSNLPV